MMVTGNVAVTNNGAAERLNKERRHGNGRARVAANRETNAGRLHATLHVKSRSSCELRIFNLDILVSVKLQVQHGYHQSHPRCAF